MHAGPLASRARIPYTRSTMTKGHDVTLSRPCAALAAAFLATLACSSVPAADYFPLRQDATWSYALDYGGERTVTVVGKADVLGVQTFEVVQVLTGADAQTFHDYWTIDAEGDLRLHRAWNETYPYDVVYDPPILFLDAPLEAGKSWSTSTDAGGAALTFACSVDALLPVSVPAGTFPCFAVSSTVTTDGKAAATHDVLGRRLDAADKAAPLRYYSDGVGLVKETDSVPGTSHRLTSWSLPTALTEATWGRIKSLFR